MAKLTAHLVCLGLIATAAQAAPVIEFYFSKMSCENLYPYSYSIPSEYGSPDVLLADPGETIYLWARTPFEPTSWGSIALCFTGDVTSGVMSPDGGWWDPPGPPPPYQIIRWESGSDFDPTDDDCIHLINVQRQGIGDGSIDRKMVWEAGGPPWFAHYCLGSIAWAHEPFGGYKWMSVASGLVVRGGYTTSTVYFGFDEFGNPELAGSGTTPGTTSTRADVFIIPEPSVLMLLAVAGLALRRR